MAKKTHVDIMEKLSALNPSEPTKTRGKSGRNPVTKKVKAKRTEPVKSPEPAVSPRMEIAKDPDLEAPVRVEPAQNPKPAAETLSSANSGFEIFGDAAKMFLGVYDHWFRMITSSNSTLKQCNNMFLNNLMDLMNPGRWGRS